MEIDSTPVPPPQEYSDCPNASQSDSSMNFDYLQGLNQGVNTTDTVMESSTSSSSLLLYTPRSFNVGNIEAGGTSKVTSDGKVDDSKAIDRPFDMNERVVTVLDQLDARVERFRKDALGLQEKRDFLLMSIDLIKSNDLLASMSESEREEVSCYMQRINSRLSTVELNVRTVRDNSQEDSLSQINALIDMMITMGDPVHSRHRCQEYLNSCGIVDANAPQTVPEESNSSSDVFVMDDGPVDKIFESALLGCTLDDQKIIKKRLQALMRYLNNQTIRD